MSLCDHDMTPYQICDNGPIIHGTSFNSVINLETGEREGTLPDFGLYLDSRWARVVAWNNSFVAWPDFRGPLYGVPAIDSIVNAILLSQHSLVEVACLGGHGRTGTALAIMTVLTSDLTVDESIERVRDLYCWHAVETREQLDFIDLVRTHKEKNID